jgi:valyl-tRNA synthetase
METRIGRMQDLVGSVREVRNRYMIDAKTPLDVFVRTSGAVAADFEQLRPFIVLLAGVGQLQTGADVAKPPLSASSVHDAFEAYVPLAGLIDVAVEIQRREKQLAEKQKLLQSIEAKLNKASFVDKAPKDVVQQQRDLVTELKRQIAVMEDILRDLRKATM